MKDLPAGLQALSELLHGRFHLKIGLSMHGMPRRTRRLSEVRVIMKDSVIGWVEEDVTDVGNPIDFH